MARCRGRATRCDERSTRHGSRAPGAGDCRSSLDVKRNLRPSITAHSSRRETGAELGRKPSDGESAFPRNSPFSVSRPQWQGGNFHTFLRAFSAQDGAVAQIRFFAGSAQALRPSHRKDLHDPEVASTGQPVGKFPRELSEGTNAARNTAPRTCPSLSPEANFHPSEMIVKTALKKPAQKPATRNAYRGHTMNANRLRIRF